MGANLKNQEQTSDMRAMSLTEWLKELSISEFYWDPQCNIFPILTFWTWEVSFALSLLVRLQFGKPVKGDIVCIPISVINVKNTDGKFHSDPFIPQSALLFMFYELEIVKLPRVRLACNTRCNVASNIQAKPKSARLRASVDEIIKTKNVCNI